MSIYIHIIYILSNYLTQNKYNDYLILFLLNETNKEIEMQSKTKDIKYIKYDVGPFHLGKQYIHPGVLAHSFISMYSLI